MSSRPVEESDIPDTINPGVLSWVAELRRVSVAVSKTETRSPTGRLQLYYFLHRTADGRHFGVTVHKGRDAGSTEEWWDIDRSLEKLPAYASDDDGLILRLLWADRSFDSGLHAFGLGPNHGAEALRRMAQSGRLCLAWDTSLPLQMSDRRAAIVSWRQELSGRQRPCLEPVPEASLVIPLQPPWYVDEKECRIGLLDVSGDQDAIARLFSLPPLSPQEARLVATALSDLVPGLPVPRETSAADLRTVNVDPLPIIEFRTLTVFGNRQWREYEGRYEKSHFDVAFPVFRYLDAEVIPGDDRDVQFLPEGEAVRVVRRFDREARLIQTLTDCGLQKIPGYALHAPEGGADDAFGLAGESCWPSFMESRLECLRQAGWEIRFDDDFRHHALEVEAWEAELTESGNGWFNLDMGVLVDGQRLALAPLLAMLFRNDQRWLDMGLLRQIPEDETVELRTPTGKRIHVPAGRLKPLAATFIDLFENYTEGSGLRVSRFDATRLAEFTDRKRWQFRGQEDLVRLADRLLRAQGIRDIQSPAGLKLDLRSYQKEGLAWLQFLRENQLSGILADDMGLGKTAQALAHLLMEKESGRLDRPALIVLPTSLIFNWKNEAARFAPDLSVLSLHGAERKGRFDEIPGHDVILTTYPLLWRDANELTRHEYHLLVLDEAQTVKNARSQSASAVRKINARHRLCLTGTPLENHLGELWSQFDFLMPGFLGESSTFARFWRTPIEKQGDTDRRDFLARRIRPFILRRKKEEVACELPLKTIIVRRIELSGGQRDLYETVRAAMDAVVREEVASKGFGRSQIVILDALLKLRQVCCDPRLVKAASAQRVRERAKLDLLMTMLPEQVDEGRRILVFSQFTSMLSLIEVELKQAGIDYTILTGDTTDRETPVKRFQTGEVPVFLISLKAGGIGLNLTAADTVIHYDPWWNPAVENQATDRAHRIGQDKPVFVYKLVVAGSIEEKILALQERKADLAAGILSEDINVALKFGEDDIAALFAPLPR